MKYAVVAFPAAVVRRKPAHSSEMVNQLLFGEMVKVLKEKKSLWVKIRSLHDNYEGWVTNTLLSELDETAACTATVFTTAHLFNTITINGASMHIPVGSSLPFFDGKEGKLGQSVYRLEGGFVDAREQKPSGELVKQLSHAWLNAPYMWGGRTPLGVDCSGLVQVVYKLMGINLPRDAWQQAQAGEAVKKFSEIKPGDLAFFDNKEDIVHTGILLGDGQIIHSSGKVKLDAITKKGIESTAPNNRALRLKAIRRVF